MHIFAFINKTYIILILHEKIFTLCNGVRDVYDSIGR